MFEEKFSNFLEEQKRNADTRRREMLERDLTGTKSMLRNILLPVFGSFDRLQMEYRFINSKGISLFIDVYYEPLRLGFECEGFSTHAETISRERFNFEKSRVRSMLKYGILYIPFSKDEIDKHSESSKNSLREILSRFRYGESTIELTIYERETLRHAAKLSSPFGLSDVRDAIGKSRNFCRQVIQSLLAKELIKPLHDTLLRHHRYILTEDGVRFL